mmetsp:Transcript_3422/g.6330  ORF Transcript_3422/g.6330 Transcript_3422/m.6330 type:complete len:92 (-) Transcript_3422:54-329(-)|eukprot:CAMPEP_0113312698 /NCGR_PEP_ID=MMETSP0010_2-20120614/9428_1 /TAXON_ID=216773 ORGANISM="Corethron hystrix, Strain 308" /NCGR_SAMPLE_ID=MMETSP0010_2 /ASSEMBLY_ACC=CAM_ASM_000155 /LENGTH=91 /DNA_ID=CAMNT_0000168583 /DNA_START=81 /DNA_END=356 /DNA_ORIENTATION=- /assembly_acc=CAM_ASM_000155
MGGQSNEAEPRREQNLEALEKARTPLAFRDSCAHILLKLNKCRRNTYYMPYECGHDRHVYEECQYNAWLQRIETKKQIDLATAAAAAAAEE